MTQSITIDFLLKLSGGDRSVDERSSELVPDNSTPTVFESSTESTSTKPVAEIATLPYDEIDALPTTNPRTAEPRRPWPIWLALNLFWLATAATGLSLLSAYWQAVFDFANATWLMNQFETEPGSLERVLLAVAITIIALVIGTATAITGYFAWAGYGWTKIAGVITVLVSISSLSLNQIGWAALLFSIVAATLLWLPPAGRFFNAWQQHRHPKSALADPLTNVVYGPLPRYRS